MLIVGQSPKIEVGKSFGHQLESIVTFWGNFLRELGVDDHFHGISNCLLEISYKFVRILKTHVTKKTSGGAEK